MNPFENKLSIKNYVLYFIFVFVPVLIVWGVSYYHFQSTSKTVIQKLESDTQIALEENQAFLTNYTLDAVKERTRCIAQQVQLYLEKYPQKTDADLRQDENFQRLALQEIGTVGYSAITNLNVMRISHHISPHAVGLDIRELSASIENYDQVEASVLSGNEAEAMYDWKEADGSIEKKFMFVVPVKTQTADGIRYSVTAGNYVNELHRPFIAFEQKENKSIQSAQKIFHKSTQDFWYYFSVSIVISTIIYGVFLYAINQKISSSPKQQETQN